MEVTEINAEGLKRAYQAKATAADIEARIDSRIAEMQPTAQLKGFRKGKAPHHLLKKLYGSNILGEVMQQMIDDTLRAHLEESTHKPVKQPNVKLVNEGFKPGDDLSIEFDYEMMPDIPEVAFKEISLERMVVTPEEEKIEEALKTLAQNMKSFEPKEGAAENGDQTVIDFIGRIEGEAFEGGAGTDFPLELGSGQFIPGFEEQLIGASAEEKRDVTVTFPEEYGAKELAGKEAVFEVTVKEVKGAVEAAIDEALAEKAGAESLEALRERIQEQFASEYRQAARAVLKRHLLDALAERLSFEVPETMTTEEAKQIAHQLWHEEHPEVEGHDHEEIEPTEEHQALAARRVRLGLFLAGTGAQNEISVTEAEIANAAALQARNYPGQERAFMNFVMSNEQMKQQLSAPVYEDKVVDFICELAEITEREASFDELEAAIKKLEEEDKQPA